MLAGSRIAACLYEEVSAIDREEGHPDFTMYRFALYCSDSVYDEGPLPVVGRDEGFFAWRIVSPFTVPIPFTMKAPSLLLVETKGSLPGAACKSKSKACSSPPFLAAPRFFVRLIVCVICVRIDGPRLLDESSTA